MQISLPNIISYVRSLDERLRDQNKYPNALIAERIKYAIDNLAIKVQPFTIEEFVDLTQYVNLGITKILFKPIQENLGYYSKSIWRLIGTNWIRDNFVSNIILTENRDRSIMIEILQPQNVAEKIAIKVEYFYSPNIIETPTMIVEPNVWSLMKHSIQAVIWGELKDYEKEQYHQKTLDIYSSQKILQIPSGLEPFKMKGGFI